MSEISEKIRYLIKKYLASKRYEIFQGDTLMGTESAIDANESHLHYGEEEIPFSNLCAIIKQEQIILASEDKALIDEIGESLWNDGPYWQNRMVSKYWKELVE